VNFIPERVSTVLFSLLDDRREIQLADNGGEVIKAHKDLLVIADMNPNYRGTRPMNKAWADRFTHQIEFPYDNRIEAKLIKSKSLLEMARKLRDKFDTEELETPISTRSLVALIENAINLGIDYALYDYVNKFDDTERSQVRLVVDTYKHSIATDLGLGVTNINPDLGDEKVVTEQQAPEVQSVVSVQPIIANVPVQPVPVPNAGVVSYE
jgi:hypothetical protein